MSESCEFEFKADWPNSKDHLNIAAIVGHTTPTSSRLWFRTGEPGKYCVLYFDGGNKISYEWFEQHKKLVWDEDTIAAAMEKGILLKLAKNGNQVDWDTNTTFVVDIGDLKAGIFYRYALCSMKEERIILGHEPGKDYGFRTPSSKSDEFSFGLHSCHMPFDVHNETTIVRDNIDMWRYFYSTLEKHSEKHGKNNNSMDFVIAGGDQVYVDTGVVDTFNIWRHLNQVMCKKDGKILPDVEMMKSWYRKIYRGYWGFDYVKKVFSSFPTYMIWDDHELRNGWGVYDFTNDHSSKNDLHKILPNLAEKGLNETEGLQLFCRMGKAAFHVYKEYQHSHNPKPETKTEQEQYDYWFLHKEYADFYILDGRGHHGINNPPYKILGKEQMKRFRCHVENLSSNIKFLFVVSAVPVHHFKSCVVNSLNTIYSLRYHWARKEHKEERKELMEILFAAAEGGIKVCILSGDVHISAAFSLTDTKNGKEHKIYQLTSSAITHKFGPFIRRIFPVITRIITAKEGTTGDGYIFERLGLYTDSSYALLKVNPDKKENKEEDVVFQMYEKNGIALPPIPLTW